MGTLVLDLETVVDPTMPQYRPDEPDAFPPPPYWQVVIAGALWLDDRGIARKLAVLPGEDDATRTAAVVDIIERPKVCPTLVTYGGRNFDVPVLTASAMRAGLNFPRRFGQMTNRYKGRHVDLSDVLSGFGGARSPGSLDAWSRTLGWPGKLDGGKGADVAVLLADGKRDHAEAYCLADVVLTAGVFLRVEQCRGELDGPGYAERIDALLEVARRDVRLAAWLDLVDLERVRRAPPAPPAPMAEPVADEPAVEEQAA